MRAASVLRNPLIAAVVLASAAPALAGPTWDSIRAEVYAGKTIRDGAGVITLEAPYRPDDVRSVPIVADAKLTDGRTIRSVTFIVDENPSPVAARFKLGEGRDHVAMTTNIRLNQQSDVRVVVEASDGEIYMAEQLVKFAGGQASCSAPPMGDPAEIAANMGKMTFAISGDKATSSHAVQRASYELNHPNHTGMVMEPISLLYVPLLMVDRIEARQGDELVWEMEGSITVAQNPRVEFDYVTNGAEEMVITARDTSGATWTQKFPIGPGS
jgi:sulfur-oxidizing protein SoxY